MMRIINLMKKKPQSMLVLINFIGFQAMPQKQHSSFDILDFYSYCSIKKKFKPDSQRLARTVELALKQQLRRILNAWKAHKNRVAQFKQSLKTNMLRRVF